MIQIVLYSCLLFLVCDIESFTINHKRLHERYQLKEKVYMANDIDSYSTSTTTESSANAVLLDKPKWTSGGPISNVVNALISFKPLFSLMKIGILFVVIIVCIIYYYY